MEPREQVYLFCWLLATIGIIAEKPIEEKYRPNGKLREHPGIRTRSEATLGCAAMFVPYLLLVFGVRPPQNFSGWVWGVSLSTVPCFVAIRYWQRKYPPEIAQWFLVKLCTDFFMRAVIQGIWWLWVWH